MNLFASSGLSVCVCVCLSKREPIQTEVVLTPNVFLARLHSSSFSRHRQKPALWKKKPALTRVTFADGVACREEEKERDDGKMEIGGGGIERAEKQ